MTNPGRPDIRGRRSISDQRGASMARARKPRGPGAKGQPGHLIVKVDKDTFYFIPPDRMGPPLALSAAQKAQLNRWIRQLGAPVIGLEFAMMVEPGEAAIRIARNN